ncbi:unnamed protein product [Leptidea sinapis]|uniref:Integrin beta epidermal growth factor-like domain-containing protein n=1 Tax=Leptidea sinapis TaxID=189913 RepID=A0A5E4QZU0_9NEOP|nr:unnamed protein product [Leptidea sinapis]
MHCKYFTIICLLCVVTVQCKIVGVNKLSVCSIKKSCEDCLQLDHCSWCASNKKCFSEHLLGFDNFCNNTIKAMDYGMSLMENAECACSGGNIKVNKCRPPGVVDGAECYGRGSCVCGTCICNTNPDPENPSKFIVGEFCEYDNYSCDGPKCNEGPYSINDIHLYEENNEDDTSANNQPVE